MIVPLGFKMLFKLPIVGRRSLKNTFHIHLTQTKKLQLALKPNFFYKLHYTPRYNCCFIVNSDYSYVFIYLDLSNNFYVNTSRSLNKILLRILYERTGRIPSSLDL